MGKAQNSFLGHMHTACDIITFPCVPHHVIGIAQKKELITVQGRQPCRYDICSLLKGAFLFSVEPFLDVDW